MGTDTQIHTQCYKQFAAFVSVYYDTELIQKPHGLFATDEEISIVILSARGIESISDRLEYVVFTVCVPTRRLRVSMIRHQLTV